MSATASLLEVKNLTVEFVGPAGLITPVNGVSFSLEKGETHCLVGESGCGKSVTALSMMRLIHPGKIIPPSSIQLEGREISQLSENRSG
jgi:ABC-type dipeptide/oligopeptide/nickel transport system ATPase component